MKLSNHKEKLILFAGSIGIGMTSLAITLGVYNVQISNSNKVEEKQIDKIDLDEGLTEAQKIVAQNIINELNELEEKSRLNDSGENREENRVEEEVSNEKVMVENEKNENEIKVIMNENDGNLINEIEDEKIDDELDDKEIVEVVAKANSGISFIKPIDSDEIGMIFADEKLVYSQTLEEWITHKGVDFLAPVGTNVIASAEGTVKEMYEDKKYGFTIVVEHGGNYISKYSGIEENGLLEIGQNVNKGDIISKIAEANGFEKSEGSHLHFEILKDGINIEPNFS